MHQGSVSSHDPQFRQQNGLIHRKITIPAEAPALTWHLGYWKPRQLDDAAWKSAVDNYIHKIVTQIKDLASKSHPSRFNSPNESGTVFSGFESRFDENGTQHSVDSFRLYELVQGVLEIGSFVVRI